MENLEHPGTCKYFHFIRSVKALTFYWVIFDTKENKWKFVVGESIQTVVYIYKKTEEWQRWRKWQTFGTKQGGAEMEKNNIHSYENNHLRLAWHCWHGIPHVNLDEMYEKFGHMQNVHIYT